VVRREFGRFCRGEPRNFAKRNLAKFAVDNWTLMLTMILNDDADVTV